MKYIDTEQVYLCVGNWNESWYRSYVKIENNKKKCLKYKVGDKHWNLCMEERLAIASYNIPIQLFNQKSEIVNVCRLNKVWLSCANFILSGGH